MYVYRLLYLTGLHCPWSFLLVEWDQQQQPGLIEGFGSFPGLQDFVQVSNKGGISTKTIPASPGICILTASMVTTKIWYSEYWGQKNHNLNRTEHHP